LKQCFEEVIPSKDNRSRISPLEFVVNLIFIQTDTKVFSLESIRRSLKTLSGQNISRSAFWERLSTKRLKNILHRLLSTLMTRLSHSILGEEDWAKKLGVQGILVLDSCSFSLWDGAKEEYPGTFVTAGIKWHSCIDLVRGSLVWSQITPSSIHDSQCFPPLKEIKNNLIIIDLAYWDFSLFFNI
jgi:hypothetical protein